MKTTPEFTVKVSSPLPPVRFVIAEKEVVVFKVPVFAAVTTHAFVPARLSVAAKVSVPPPPAITPLKVKTFVASVKISVPAPPTRLPTFVKLSGPLLAPTAAMFPWSAPVRFQVFPPALEIV